MLGQWIWLAQLRLVFMDKPDFKNCATIRTNMVAAWSGQPKIKSVIFFQVAKSTTDHQHSLVAINFDAQAWIDKLFNDQNCGGSLNQLAQKQKYGLPSSSKPTRDRQCCQVCCFLRKPTRQSSFHLWHDDFLSSQMPTLSAAPAG